MNVKPIPFHKRLVFRLAAGMLSVALISLLVVFAIQSISFTVLDLEPRSIFLRRLQLLFSDTPNPPPPNSESISEYGRAGSAFSGEGAQNRFRVRQIFEISSLIGFITSGILWTFFAIRFSRSIAKPIEEVTQAAAQITEGNLTTRVGVPENAVGESVQLLEHFNQMATSLETYEQERTEMIASIAHELRTPLAVTRSRLELMQDGIVELNQNEVNRMIRQTDLLTRLVSDLRTLSLADANKLSLETTQVQFDELIHDVSESFKGSAKEKQLNIELALEAIQLEADSDRLYQVIFNLIDNAIKHTPEGGNIQLALNADNNMVTFSIQDSGNGFVGEVEDLFKRFYTTKQDNGSSGIGLAVVRTIVNLHGGEITAHNAKDGGAVFKIHFPLDV